MHAAAPLRGTARDNGTLYRLAAFADGEHGGNPAGVWIGDDLPDPAAMLAIARDVGYSETAFVAPASGPTRTIRYYSPLAEVTFCGHATIATGVVLGLGDGEGTYRLQTRIGDVPVDAHSANGRIVAALTSVNTRHEQPAAELLQGALQALGWSMNSLDGALPPAKAYAGAWHLVLAVKERATLDALEYDFDVLQALMLANELTTLQLVWREREDRYHSRNPFPVGGVVEDPATGAAAAAFGGYLRDAGFVQAPASITIRQGEIMGRPSLLRVRIPAAGGIVVEGTAIKIDSAP